MPQFDANRQFVETTLNSSIIWCCQFWRIVRYANQNTPRAAKERYGARDFNYHILPVVKNALLLAEKLDADLEVVEAAAYLHDIGRAVEREGFEAENEHHILGARKAKELLKDAGYDSEFIKRVEHRVLVHRGRKGPSPETKEAEIIACADAMAHFDTFLDVLSFFLVTCGSFEEAVLKAEQKMQRNWNRKLTLQEAREIARPKYEAIMLLIKSMKEYLKPA